MWQRGLIQLLPQAMQPTATCINPLQRENIIKNQRFSIFVETPCHYCINLLHSLQTTNWPVFILGKICALHDKIINALLKLPIGKSGKIRSNRTNYAE
jgi:hypothetical protein